MGFLNKLFGKDKPSVGSDGGYQLAQLVIPLSDGEFGSDDEQQRCFALETKIGDAIADAGAGMLDGNDIGGGEFTIWCYSDDARGMVNIIRDKAIEANLHHGAHILLRLGEGDDAPEERIEL